MLSWLPAGLPVLATLLAGLAFAQASPETAMRVKLLSPISTESSQPNDRITAQVLTPPGYAGAMLEGKVREAKGGKKIKGSASLNFTFDTLHLNGQQRTIQSTIQSVVNSQGAKDVDEEGRVVKKKNTLGKAALATAIGAGIGAAIGGGRGAAIGAGAGAAAGILMIQLAVDGAQVSFAPGSEFDLRVREIRQQ
jgi:hypothetical protein